MFLMEIVYYDINPIRATSTNGYVFAATNGSSTITATDMHMEQLQEILLLLHKLLV